MGKNKDQENNHSDKGVSDQDQENTQLTLSYLATDKRKKSIPASNNVEGLAIH